MRKNDFNPNFGDYKLNSGQNLTLKNKMIHRMFAKSKKSLYMEVSTSQLNDVVRISDDYNRV